GRRSLRAGGRDGGRRGAPGGDEPMTNRERREVSAAAVETAAPAVTSRTSLPYYTRPRTRRRRAVAAESLRPEPARVQEAATEVLTDVAAASFGSSATHTNKMVLEAVIGEDDRVRVSPQRMAM